MALADLLKPYRPKVIAEATGAAKGTVQTWLSGRSRPSAAQLPRLAEFLRMDLGELTRMVAAESRATEGSGGLQD